MCVRVWMYVSGWVGVCVGVRVSKEQSSRGSSRWNCSILDGGSLHPSNNELKHEWRRAGGLMAVNGTLHAVWIKLSFHRTISLLSSLLHWVDLERGKNGFWKSHFSLRGTNQSDTTWIDFLGGTIIWVGFQWRQVFVKTVLSLYSGVLVEWVVFVIEISYVAMFLRLWKRWSFDDQLKETFIWK